MSRTHGGDFVGHGMSATPPEPFVCGRCGQSAPILFRRITEGANAWRCRACCRASDAALVRARRVVRMLSARERAAMRTPLVMRWSA